MSEAKHTPGRWRACREGECRCGMIWSTGQDVMIVTAYGEKEHGVKQFAIAAAHRDSGDAADLVYSVVPAPEQAANARLIAAAPELLAACEACRTELAYLIEQTKSRPGGSVVAAYDKAVAAIAAAKE